LRLQVQLRLTKVQLGKFVDSAQRVVCSTILIATQKWSKIFSLLATEPVQQLAALTSLGDDDGRIILPSETIEFTVATGRSLIIAAGSGAFGYGLAFLLYLWGYVINQRVEFRLT